MTALDTVGHLVIAHGTEAQCCKSKRSLTYPFTIAYPGHIRLELDVGELKILNMSGCSISTIILLCNLNAAVTVLSF